MIQSDGKRLRLCTTHNSSNGIKTDTYNQCYSSLAELAQIKNKVPRQAFGTAVKVLLKETRIPYHDDSVRVLDLFPIPASCKCREWCKPLGHCHPRGRLGLNSKLLVSVWFRIGHCRHWDVNQQMEGL